jgi:hypothetical protein
VNGSNVGRASGDYVRTRHDDVSQSHAMYRTESGVDLMGGVSMGLFYIISGFVLMLGYGIGHGR